MDDTGSIAQQCRTVGVLMTPKRQKLVRRLESREGVFHADILREELAAEGESVSRTMVYRTLRQLAQEGVLVSLGFREGRQLFSKPSQHAIRIVDRVTGDAYDLDAPDLRARIAVIVGELGLSLDGRDIELVIGDAPPAP